MSRTRLARGIVATIATTSLALVGVGLGAGPASADLLYVPSSSMIWNDVDDTTGMIEDGYQYDHASDLEGWTDDAFDGFGSLTLTEPAFGGTWNFVADRPAVSNIVEGGTSTLTLTGTTPPIWDYPDVSSRQETPVLGGVPTTAPYTVVLTLTLEGNYARWSYSIDGPDVEGLLIDFGGNLGSDDLSVFLTDDTTVVSTDGDDGDPVLGYSVDTDGTFDGWYTNDSDDWVAAQATGASTFTVTLVAVDYNVCGFDEARTFVESIVGNLQNTFGESHQTVGTCMTFEPIALEEGVAVNQVLAYTVAPELIDSGYFAARGLIVTAELTDLPAGLEYSTETLEDGTIQITLTGTPTEGGDFTPTAVFYQAYQEIDVELPQGRLAPTTLPGQLPVYSPVTVFVEAIVVPEEPTPAPEPEPETPAPAPAAPAPAPAAPAPTAVVATGTTSVALAATGFDGALAAGLGGLVALLGAAFLGLNVLRKKRA